MRVKTDARRTAIVQAAWEVFRTQGYDRASMSEISNRVGGSKATLYGYFKSKDELFLAALEEALEEKKEQAFEKLAAPGPLRPRLLAYARAHLALRLDPDVVAVHRMLIAEAERSTITKTLREQHMAPSRARYARVFEAEMEAGTLRRADPARAARHFRALVEADLFERRIFGDVDISSEAIEAEVEAGVETFLRAYAP